ncbi:hypothetical protein H7W66_000891 [Campylobacter coli]|nr:hypothetical protein [Campylobacter coli]EFS2166975.1 hypothetical protein [Campylobacter coli]EGD3384090.1 hypothetical protein [Campylobacter coli]
MGENVKSDRESSSQEHTKSPNKTIHLESNIESKNLKNNNEVRLDSNGDEIVFEIWHNPTWWDYFLMSVFFVFGIAMIYWGIKDFLSNEIDKSLFITLLVFGIPIVLLSFYCLFYARKNRFYITTQGIGFERRKWFRMQKGFFKFGEVGFQIVLAPTGLCPITPINKIIIFPLGNHKGRIILTWQLNPLYSLSLMAWKTYISPKLYNEITEQSYLKDFLIKKNKEALKAQGVNTDILCYDLDKQFF